MLGSERIRNLWINADDNGVSRRKLFKFCFHSPKIKFGNKKGTSRDIAKRFFILPDYNVAQKSLKEK